MSMHVSNGRQAGAFRAAAVVGALLSAALLSACETPAPSKFPPSASDLVLLKSAKLCERKAPVLARLAGVPVRHEVWGTGEELRIPADRSATGAEESLFFDQDDQLVGLLFVFPSGVSLKSYPVLRETLGQLKPSLEFYLNIAAVSARESLDPSTLYETGDATSTVRYLVLNGDPLTLLAASFSIDPYAKLISPYRAEFLSRIERSGKAPGGGKPSGKGSMDREPFAALQQFARGETAHFGSCGAKDEVRAADAYGKAITVGFSDKVWLAEAHHKLGLALERSGKLEPAKAAMQKALTIRPNTAEFLNSLGSVYARLGDHAQAVAAFERAVTLRPNYPVARFNLAEAYAQVNARRAIAEYETYLALVEGAEEEQSRIVRAQERVQQLKKR
jgi:tetratricopeptide (TPR) repeat protein